MSTIARKFRPLQEAVLRHRRTIFNDTHLSLEKWYMAVALMVNAKKGVSAKQLQRDLGTAYQTSWYLSHRIRNGQFPNWLQSFRYPNRPCRYG